MGTTAIESTANGFCFVCGQRHPNGLHLRFMPDGPDRVLAEWRPESTFQGFPGVIHGGIVSTVLDEAMSKAVAGAGLRALTCELRIRLRRSVTPDEPLALRGWIVQQRKRLITTEAVLTDAQGHERAHAWGSFLQLPPANGAG